MGLVVAIDLQMCENMQFASMQRFWEAPTFDF